MELLVGVAILALLVTMMLSIFSGVSNLWAEFQARKGREQTARVALEAISRDLRSAAFPVGTQVRDSLAFLVSPASVGSQYLCPDAAFWQSANPTSPVGFSDVGYFIRWDGDRSELCQLRVPHDDPDSIFVDTDRSISTAVLDRLAPGSANTDLRGLLAENVIGIWFQPLDHEGALLPTPYDSSIATTHPAFVQVAIAVIDATTAKRVGDGAAIRAAYSDDPESFLSALPEQIARGVRIFTERIPVYANP